jgi:hypothetical protein
LSLDFVLIGQKIHVPSSPPTLHQICILNFYCSEEAFKKELRYFSNTYLCQGEQQEFKTMTVTMTVTKDDAESSKDANRHPEDQRTPPGTEMEYRIALFEISI